ncbi:MAG: type II secretion system F family protein [Bacillota bacterium]|nr:type II secretion system F family protein [Bacillota bacterium]
MAVLIAVLAFISVSLLVHLLTVAPENERQRLLRRLTQLDAGGRPAYAERDRELEVSLVTRLARPVVTELARLVGRFTPKGMREEIRRKLTAAGNPGGMQVQDFLAFKGLLVIALPVGTFLALWRNNPTTALLLAAVAFAAGNVLPDLLLKSAINNRKRAIQKALPDMLDLLTVSVEAGLAFDSAIGKVVEKLKGPLADEFQRMLHDVRMGMPRREALKEVASRTDVPDLNTFIASLIQADTLGVSISKVLRIQSEQMRNRRKQRAEETAMKAPIKMIFPLLIFIFPTIFIVLLGPAVLQIIDTFVKAGPR